MDRGHETCPRVADWLRELTSCLIRLRLQAMRVCLAIRQRIQDRFLRHFLPADTTLIVYGPTGKPYRYEGKRTS